MELVERYLQAVALALPAKQRGDIITELRSSIYDDLEGDTQPSEEQVVRYLQKLGAPHMIAAQYYPNLGYLIGPQIYPLFMQICKLVLVCVISVQLMLSAFDGGLNAFSSSFGVFDIVQSAIFALGMVVLIFWGIQYNNLPVDQQKFDPRNLPAFEGETKPTNRGEHIFSILVNIVMLTVLSRIVQEGGFLWGRDGVWFENPIITQFFGLIVVAAVAQIALEIIVAWQGHWQFRTRVASFAINVLSLLIALFMYQGHDRWLQSHNAEGLFESIETWPQYFADANPLTGMLFFRMFIAGAIVVLLIVTITSFVQVWKSWVKRTSLQVSAS